MNKFICLSMLSLFVVGCLTTPSQETRSQSSKVTQALPPQALSPYDYKATAGDAIVITDKFVKSAQVDRLKVSVLSKSAGKDQPFMTDKVVRSKMVEAVSKSAFFEIATREDLANIVVEAENSGVAGSGVLPSELVIVIESKIVNYLGGMTEVERERKLQYAEALRKHGHGKEYYKAMSDLRAGAQRAVDDPKVAFGVEMFVKCSAYDVLTKRLYVSDAQTVSKITNTRGRIDAAIDEIGGEVAELFAKKLSLRVAPAMKTDSVIEETRGDGAVAKVNVAALQRKFRENEKVVVYTYSVSKNQPKRKNIAEGRVLKIEDTENVWIKVDRDYGYGKVHVGHCVDFPEVN